MENTPLADNSLRTHQRGLDNITGQLSGSQIGDSNPTSQLPPPKLIGVSEKDYPNPAVRPLSNVIWQRKFDSPSTAATKPPSVTPKPPIKRLSQDEVALPFPDTCESENSKTHTIWQPADKIWKQHPIKQQLAQAELEKNDTSAKVDNTQPLPVFHKTESVKSSDYFSDKQSLISPQEPPGQHLQTAENLKFNKDDPEINRIKPSSQQVVRENHQETTRRGKIKFLHWVFSLSSVAVLALAAFGGWELWRRIDKVESQAGSVSNELRAQLLETTNRVSQLENSVKELLASSTSLSDLRHEAATERRLLKDTLAAMAIRLEELESNAKSLPRSISISEQEIQEVRKDLAQIRDSFSNQQNKIASDIATLQRRIEIIENFLTRATQRNQQQQQQQHQRR